MSATVRLAVGERYLLAVPAGSEANLSLNLNVPLDNNDNGDSISVISLSACDSMAKDRANEQKWWVTARVPGRASVRVTGEEHYEILTTNFEVYDKVYGVAIKVSAEEKAAAASGERLHSASGMVTYSSAISSNVLGANSSSSSSCNDAPSAMESPVSVPHVLAQGPPSSHQDEACTDNVALSQGPAVDAVRIIDPVEIIAQIGSGNYGSVFSARWRGTPVAAKVVLDPDEVRRELSVLQSVRHPNCVQFLGLSSAVDYKHLLVFELMEGSVLSLLQSPGKLLKKIDKIRMLLEACRGMAYLHEHGIIHRDLATRNLLYETLGQKRHRVKWADFGLSRDVSQSGAYSSQGAAMPVRWTAPEHFAQGESTTASDIYSFGIVCWELFNDGRVPFTALKNSEVIDVAQDGKVHEHLTAPTACPDELYVLMQKMWNPIPDQRPGARRIESMLESLAAALLVPTIRVAAHSADAALAEYDDLAADAPPNTPTTPDFAWRMLFVCIGNTCRSPMAEFLAKKSLSDSLTPEQAERVLVLSSGTSAQAGDRANALAVEVLRDFANLDMTSHRAMPFDHAFAKKFDIVVVMDRRQKARCEQVLGGAAKIVCLDVEDPYGMDRDTYEECAREIQAKIRPFIEEAIEHARKAEQLSRA